jgi:hypothetical protein
MTSMFRSAPSSLRPTLGDLYRCQNDHEFSVRLDRDRHLLAIASWHRSLLFLMGNVALGSMSTSKIQLSTITSMNVDIYSSGSSLRRYRMLASTDRRPIASISIPVSER